MCCRPCRVGIVFYGILQVFAFLCILVGTPVDQFRVQNTDLLSDTPCLTLWGWKSRCNSAEWDVLTKNWWAGCPARLTRFRAAEALAIAAVLTSGVACLFGLVMLCCCHCLRWLCLLLSIIGTGCAFAVAALMMDALYNNHEEGLQMYNMSCSALREKGSVIVYPTTAGIAGMLTNYKLGAGFVLYAVGGALSLINIVFVILPC